MIRISAVLAALVIMSGCSITQEVKPVAAYDRNELCLIENASVREGVLVALESSLEGERVNYRVVDGRSVPEECRWTLTYVGQWTWDLALYMSYAEIKVFEGQDLQGSAVYDSRRGGGNMNKFIDAESKIRELVNELFGKQSAALYRQFRG